MGSVFSSPLLWLPCPLRCQLHRRALGSLRSSHLVNPPCSISQSTIVAGRQMPSPQWCSPRSRFCNMTKNMIRKIFVKNESQGVQTIQHHAPHWLAQSFVALIYIYIYMNHFRQFSSAMRTTYIIQLLIVQNASTWAVWLQVKILHYQTIDYNHLDQSSSFGAMESEPNKSKNNIWFWWLWPVNADCGGEVASKIGQHCHSTLITKKF